MGRGAADEKGACSDGRLHVVAHRIQNVVVRVIFVRIHTAYTHQHIFRRSLASHAIRHVPRPRTSLSLLSIRPNEPLPTDIPLARTTPSLPLLDSLLPLHLFMLRHLSFRSTDVRLGWKTVLYLSRIAAHMLSAPLYVEWPERSAFSSSFVKRMRCFFLLSGPR